MGYRCLLIYLALVCCVPIQAADKLDMLWSEPVLYRGMGTHSFSIQSENPLAQKYFDQALVLWYGYNYPEAARSFRQASRLDPNRAIYHWGEALSLARAIESSGDHWNVAAVSALQKAKDRLPERSEKLSDLIEALAIRYRKTAKGYAIDDEAYVNRMKRLVRKYPDDPDVYALYAKAHMDSVNMMASMKEGQPTGASKEILDALEMGLSLDPRHPGLLHFQIHALENAGLSSKGEPAADALLGVVPGSGHLQHMPAHIYFYVGRYHDATAANLLGIQADEALFAQGGVKQPEYGGFYLHNHYYLFDCLIMEGRSKELMSVAQDLVRKVQSGEYPSDVRLRNTFLSVPYLTMARLGKWDQIRRLPAPDPELFYATGAWQYAKGLAAVRSGNLQAAKRSLTQLAQSQKNYEQENPHDAMADLLTLCELDLSSQIAEAEGNTGRQIELLSKAIAIEDGIYLHMLPWYFPLRLAIGDALLKAGDPETAEQAFRDDLNRHPNNPWALYGLAEALQAQGKIQEAKRVADELETAWQYADFALNGARF